MASGATSLVTSKLLVTDTRYVDNFLLDRQDKSLLVRAVGVGYSAVL